MNRREVLGVAGLSCAAGAVALTSCRSSSHHSSGSTGPGKPPAADASLLNELLDLEHRVIAAYSAGIPLLSGPVKDAAKRFLEHELSHSGELHGLVHKAGVVPVEAKAAYRLGQPRSSRDVLALLIELERREQAALIAAIPRLTLGSSRAAIAAVLGSDHQHLTVLREALGADPLPTPLPGPAS